MRGEVARSDSAQRLASRSASCFIPRSRSGVEERWAGGAVVRDAPRRGGGVGLKVGALLPRSRGCGEHCLGVVSKSVARHVRCTDSSLAQRGELSGDRERVEQYAGCVVV